LLEGPLLLVRGLLAEGFKIGGVTIPPVSWLAVLVLAVYAGWRLKDWTLALLVFLCLGYLALFGRWPGSMVTLSSIVVAVPIAAFLGLLLGLWAFRRPRAERALTPLLDFMQTAPIFAYLVPMLFFFGFGPVAAMVGT